MFCSACGTRLVDRARFCPKCGAQVDASSPSVEAGSDLAGEVELGSLSEVALLSLNWEAMDRSGYFEKLRLQGDKLAYARGIDSRHGGEWFPRGYFDECVVDLTEDEREMAGRLFASVATSRLEKACSKAAREADSWDIPCGGIGPSFSLFCEYAGGRPPFRICADEPPGEAVRLRRFLDCVAKRAHPPMTLHMGIMHRRGRSTRADPSGGDSFSAANLAFCGSFSVVRDAVVRCAVGDREIEVRVTPFEDAIVLDVGISYLGSARACVSAHPLWKRLMVELDEPASLVDGVGDELDRWEFLVSKTPELCGEDAFSDCSDGPFARGGGVRRGIGVKP